MDKFGIFKLLSSVLSSATAEKPISEETGESLTGSSAANAPKNHTRPKEKTQAKTAVPIQSSMLNVLRNHDDFIRRVQKRNGQKK